MILCQRTCRDNITKGDGINFYSFVLMSVHVSDFVDKWHKKWARLACGTGNKNKQQPS